MHEWYFQVTLVSMPRHAKTRKFKGFAFVEFASVADASEACQLFSERGADGWLVVTKMEWIRTRKRYGRIREKCGRVAPQQQPEDGKDEETKAQKRPAEEIEETHDAVAVDREMGEDREEGIQSVHLDSDQGQTKKRKRKKKKADTNDTASPS